MVGGPVRRGGVALASLLIGLGAFTPPAGAAAGRTVTRSAPTLRARLLSLSDLPSGWSPSSSGGSTDQASCLAGLHPSTKGWRQAHDGFVEGSGLPALTESLASGPDSARVFASVTRTLGACRSTSFRSGSTSYHASVRTLSLPGLAGDARAYAWRFTADRIALAVDLVVFSTHDVLGSVVLVSVGAPAPPTAVAVADAAIAKAGGGSGTVLLRDSVASAPVRTVDTRLGRVGYRILGSGPTLVLIPGYASTMDVWDPRFVDALAERYRVVLPDNAGVGRTAPVRSPLTVDEMAEQASAFLTALHLGRPDVLGWSMGGMIAQALAVLHPDQVGKLVLCATFPGTGTVKPPQSEIDALTAGGAAGLAAIFPASSGGAGPSYVAALGAYPAAPPVPASTVAAQGRAALAWFDGKDSAGRRTRSVEAPTLVADGSEDRLDAVANDRRLAAGLRDATLQLYRGAGHAFLFQDESAFVPLVERFLGRLVARRATRPRIPPATARPSS